ncbi:MAG: hypothetical protein K8T89_09525 [Planctomycetes bacterium]|nr:hypothetical protein [Planctomycetota bacterium]
MTQLPQSEIRPELLQEQFRSLDEEICTYFRVLPRLLQEGAEGRVALIQGNDLDSLWDTMDDALQAGYDKFGLGRFMTQPIERKYIDGMPLFFRVDSTQASA